jgi:hypothetical protein
VRAACERRAASSAIESSGHPMQQRIFAIAAVARFLDKLG